MKRPIIFEQPRTAADKPKKHTIIRRASMSLQEQIQRMLRQHHEDLESGDEGFVDELNRGDDELQSPHELVRDPETGLECSRWELDSVRHHLAQRDQEIRASAHKAVRKPKKDAERRAAKDDSLRESDEPQKDPKEPY